MLITAAQHNEAECEQDYTHTYTHKDRQISQTHEKENTKNGVYKTMMKAKSRKIKSNIS